jgi:ATP-binding cassette, subfamily B, bacterial
VCSIKGEIDTSLLSQFKWVLNFLRPYRVKAAIAAALGAAIAGITLLVPKFVQLTVDEVLPTRDLEHFRFLLWLMAGSAVLLIAAMVWKRSVETAYQTRVSGDMQLAVFEQLRRLGFSYYERNPAGETMSLFHHELNVLQRIHTRYVPSIVQHTLTLIVALAFMVSISWQLSLVFLPAIVLYYAIGPYFERSSAEYAERLSQLHTELNKKQYDSISAVPELRASGRSEWDLSRLLEQDRQTAEVNKVYFKLINYRGAFRRVAVYLSGVLMLLLGYWLHARGMITVGAFAAFALLYYKIMFDLTVLITSVTEQKVLLLQTLRLQRFMQQKPAVPEPDKPAILQEAKGEIDLLNVTFGYSNDAPVLLDVSLRIRRGEKVAFVGTSGHGKTTLLKLIGRFYDPDEGEIRLDGIPLRSIASRELRRHIGYVFQETYLFGATVMDNIRFARPEATDAEVIEAAKAASAHAFITELPSGYDTLLGERGSKLSGGQKQRIAIARAALRNPAVLILDEATSALDNVTEAEVKRAIDLLFAGRTIVAVAHRLSTIRDFDTIYVIEHGRIAEAGSYEELLGLGGVFSRLAAREEDTYARVAMDA